LLQCRANGLGLVSHCGDARVRLPCFDYLRAIGQLNLYGAVTERKRDGLHREAPGRKGDAESTLVDLLCGVDQFFETDESFPSRLDATRQEDEVEAGFHDVVRAAVAGNNRSRFAFPHGLLLSVAGEMVKGRLESALIYLPIRMGLFTAAKAAVAGTPRWLFWNSRIVADRLKPSFFLATRMPS
jgi:hypothetical protein